MNNKSGYTRGVFVLLFLLVIIFMPFFTIWAFNNLFHMEISYSLRNWLSVIIMSMFFKGSGFKFTSKQ